MWHQKEITHQSFFFFAPKISSFGAYSDCLLVCASTRDIWQKVHQLSSRALTNTFKHDREPAGPLHNAAPSTRRSRDSTHIARDVYAASAHHR